MTQSSKQYLAWAALSLLYVAAAPTALAQSTTTSTDGGRLAISEGATGSAQSPADDATQSTTDETKTAEQKELEALRNELDEKLLGPWSLVAKIDKPLTPKLVEQAALHCLDQMTIKGIQFEISAAQELPDITSLYGDVVYYRTENGLQRVNISLGQVVLIKEIVKKPVRNNQFVWGLRGDALSFRVRFSESVPGFPKLKFMLEEAGLYLRCPLQNSES